MQSQVTEVLALMACADHPAATDTMKRPPFSLTLLFEANKAGQLMIIITALGRSRHQNYLKINTSLGETDLESETLSQK